MPEKVAAWIMFPGVLGLLVFSASSSARTVDCILWPVRLGVIAGVSRFLLWSRWRRRAAPFGTRQSAPGDTVDDFLSAVLRCFYGEPQQPR